MLAKDCIKPVRNPVMYHSGSEEGKICEDLEEKKTRHNKQPTIFALDNTCHSGS